MLLYIELKEMTFEDGIKHKIIYAMSDVKFPYYDVVIEIPDDDKFIKDTMKTIYKTNKKGKEIEEIESRCFITKEQDTWNSFPLYEFKDGKIIDFDYTQYEYFLDTDRRIALASKINTLYNPSSEAKLLRKTIRILLDHLGIVDEKFEKYNTKVEAIIGKNPK